MYIFIDYSNVCATLNGLLELILDLGIGGYFAFVSFFALATCLLVPGIIMTVGSGFIYSSLYGMTLGITIASILVFLGASLGATLSMLIGRYVFRKAMKRKMRKNLKLQGFDQCLV